MLPGPHWSGRLSASVTWFQLCPPSSLCSRNAVAQPCMAQLSWSKTLAQASPGDPGGPAARPTRTSGDSGTGLVIRPKARQWRPPSALARTLITDPAGSAAHIWPAAAAVANTGPGAASTGVQCAPPSRLTSSWLGQRVVEGTARQRSDVATPSRPEKNWTWFTAAGSRAITRQCRPASVVPISVRPQEAPEPGQAISAQACAGSVALRASGSPAPCHCGCQVRPAVTECQISARAAPLPG